MFKLKLIVLIVSYYFLVILTGCSGPPNFISSKITKGKLGKKQFYKIGSMGKESLQFYEIFMRCSNLKSYSGKNFTLIENSKIAERKHSALNEITVLHFKPNRPEKEIFLQLNEQKQKILALPEGYKSFSTTTVDHKLEQCFYLFDEILRVEFMLPESEYPDAKFIKVLGFRNFSEKDSIVFDMDHFFGSGDNLYNIYSQSCDANWDLKFDIRQ